MTQTKKWNDQWTTVLKTDAHAADESIMGICRIFHTIYFLDWMVANEQWPIIHLHIPPYPDEVVASRGARAWGIQVTELQKHSFESSEMMRWVWNSLPQDPMIVIFSIWSSRCLGFCFHFQTQMVWNRALRSGPSQETIELTTRWYPIPYVGEHNSITRTRKVDISDISLVHGVLNQTYWISPTPPSFLRHGPLRGFPWVGMPSTRALRPSTTNAQRGFGPCGRRHQRKHLDWDKLRTDCLYTPFTNWIVHPGIVFAWLHFQLSLWWSVRIAGMNVLAGWFTKDDEGWNM